MNESALKDLRRLKQEEGALVSLASKINDQLNRLKVEELALQNLIRLQSEKDDTSTLENLESRPSTTIGNVEDDEEEELVKLDLNVKSREMVSQGGDEEEEEEEDEEEEEAESGSTHDELTQFIRELS
ncbi:hypothetical protein ACJMK2_036055 [Sinanodonta woodiana]|uniref:snRNA-activating protein complex subunit 5 n=1 Tax=Sinanodonta woodiana TaxID=1069815 RepID=A0ABD3WFZ8_SINWO